MSGMLIIWSPKYGACNAQPSSRCWVGVAFARVPLHTSVPLHASVPPGHRAHPTSLPHASQHGTVSAQWENANAATSAGRAPACDARQDSALQGRRLDDLALDGKHIAAADLLQVPVGHTHMYAHTHPAAAVSNSATATAAPQPLTHPFALGYAASSLACSPSYGWGQQRWTLKACRDVPLRHAGYSWAAGHPCARTHTYAHGRMCITFNPLCQGGRTVPAHSVMHVHILWCLQAAHVAADHEHP